MEKRNGLVTGWAAVGWILALGVLLTVVCGLENAPRFLADPAEVTDAAGEVLDCARSGDYEKLEQLLWGCPDLGPIPEKGEDAQSRIWNAYLDSIRYTISGEPVPTDSGVSLGVKVSCLDIPGILDALGQTVPERLFREAKENQGKEEIYDGDYHYREAFVSRILRDSAAQLLSRDAKTVEHELTLQLVRADGRWQVVPDQQLLELLSGFLSE